MVVYAAHTGVGGLHLQATCCLQGGWEWWQVAAGGEAAEARGCAATEVVESADAPAAEEARARLLSLTGRGG